jgi:hypothetical protein
MIILVTGRQGTGKSTIAARCSDHLHAPVFAWDWCMAALTSFPTLQPAVERLDRDAYRELGWSMVFQNARAQLRLGLDAVLDGMAGDESVRATRALGEELEVPSLVVLTTCDDAAVQRSRIEGRQRNIPGWHELAWEQVERSRATWSPPTDVDLTLDSTRPIDACVADLIARLAEFQPDDRPEHGERVARSVKQHCD